MLDPANIIFKERNMVIKEAKPSDIYNEKNLSDINYRGTQQ